MEIRADLMKFLSEQAFDGILLPITEIPQMAPQAAKDYLADIKNLRRAGALKTEVARLKNAAGVALMRHTKNEQEIAFNRGILHGLESLEQRIALLCEMKIDEKK